MLDVIFMKLHIFIADVYKLKLRFETWENLGSKNTFVRLLLLFSC